MPIGCEDIPLLVCSVIFPPASILFDVGCTKDLAISCLLTTLGYGYYQSSFCCSLRRLTLYLLF
jgi:uncharacterized membrane protein YqaE (UPF0057 family)